MSSPSLSPGMRELCDKLRRNDLSVRDVNGDYLQYESARHVWDALCHNTQVERLSLDVARLNERDVTNESTAPLLQFLRESSSLGTVTLSANSRRYSNSRQDQLAQCLRAIARNSGTNIKTLALKIEGDYKVPTMAFATLIGETKSIQTLDVSECRFQDSATTEELDALHAAVLQNDSIRAIDLRLAFITVVPDALVTSLGRHACLQILKLWTIGLKATMSQMQALASLLRGTKTLERLQLSFSFDKKEVMDCLVEGLKANETLIELSFSHNQYNSFSTDTKQSLAEYMQSPKQGHSIRELLLLPSNFNLDRDEDYSAFVVSMLAIPLKDDERGNNKSPNGTSATAGSPTVGSSLQLLDFTDGGPDAAFYRAFAEQAARIPLPSLKIDRIVRDFEAFHALLPMLLYLREFIAPSRQYAEADAFVRALKTNGSLSNVIIAYTNRDLSQEPLKRLIKAYCKRNATLPALLSNIQGDDDSCDGSLGDNVAASSGTSLSQLPTLFTATQLPSRHPNLF